MIQKGKKIAMVSDAVYPFNKGGKEKRMYDITTRLVEKGYEVTIYCMQWWPKEKGSRIVQDGVILEAISPYYPLYAGNRRSIKEAIFFALNCLKLLNKKFDVIEVDHMPHLVLFTVKVVCLLKRKKMFVTWHEVWGKEYWKQYLGVAGILAYWIEKISVRLPDVIVSVSNHTTSALKNILDTKKQIITITNGLDLKSIENSTPSKLTSDLIFAGRLLPHKNVDVLLKAVSNLKGKKPEISLFVVGEGPELKKLQTLSIELGIQKNVRFFGFFEDHHEVYGLMKSSQIFVLPSTREGFGISALEANACGLPIITTDDEQNATKELIINGQNGTTINLSEDQIAKAVENILNAKKDHSVYPKYAEKYNWDNIIIEVQKAYNV